jgi:hypothetical protein
VRLLAPVLLVVLAGCSAGAPTPTEIGWPAWEPARELPAGGELDDGRPGPNGGTILLPASAQVATGVPYRFSLGHCGLMSPVDVDGSFWEALEGVDAEGGQIDLGADSEMINATSGIIVVNDDEARFRTDSSSVVRFERHDGEREFPGCD